MGNYFSNLNLTKPVNINDNFDKYNKYTNEPLKYKVNINKFYRPSLKTIYE
jgi:hypothetical protein